MIFLVTLWCVHEHFSVRFLYSKIQFFSNGQKFKDDVKECYHDDNNSLKVEYLFEYCSKVYPERFFDILYRNEEIMNDEITAKNFFFENLTTDFL